MPNILAKVVSHLEEPIGDPATILLYQLSELTRHHVTVVLTGEGSDETNLGYAKARAFRRWVELGARPLVGGLLEALWLHRWAPGARGRSPFRADLERVYAELSWPGTAQRMADACSPAARLSCALGMLVLPA